MSSDIISQWVHVGKRMCTIHPESKTYPVTKHNVSLGREGCRCFPRGNSELHRANFRKRRDEKVLEDESMSKERAHGAWKEEASRLRGRFSTWWLTLEIASVSPQLFVAPHRTIVNTAIHSCFLCFHRRNCCRTYHQKMGRIDVSQFSKRVQRNLAYQLKDGLCLGLMTSWFIYLCIPMGTMNQYGYVHRGNNKNRLERKFYQDPSYRHRERRSPWNSS